MLFRIPACAFETEGWLGPQLGWFGAVGLCGVRGWEGRRRRRKGKTAKWPRVVVWGGGRGVVGMGPKQARAGRWGWGLPCQPLNLRPTFHNRPICGRQVAFPQPARRDSKQHKSAPRTSARPLGHGYLRFWAGSSSQLLRLMLWKRQKP